MTALEQLRTRVNARQSSKPLSSKDMIALIDGLIENQNQLETKVDQLLSAIQPSADKTNTKTSAKKNTA